MSSSAEKVMQLDAMMPVIREQLEAGKSVKFMPRGISMLPMLRQGRDSVELHPLTGKLKKYDLPLYQRDNGQYVIHRVIKVGDTYTCLGDNQFYPEPGLEDRHMIAIVKVFYRDNKRYTVDSAGYKLYCRLWYHSRGFRRLCRRGKNFLLRILKISKR